MKIETFCTFVSIAIMAFCAFKYGQPFDDRAIVLMGIAFIVVSCIGPLLFYIGKLKMTSYEDYDKYFEEKYERRRKERQEKILEEVFEDKPDNFNKYLAFFVFIEFIFFVALIIEKI